MIKDCISEENKVQFSTSKRTAVQRAVKRESYVVVGRCADYILRKNPNTISVFLYASKEECLRHEMEYNDISQNKARKEILRMDRYWRDYYRYHTVKRRTGK